jgi:hypothetical protein
MYWCENCNVHISREADIEKHIEEVHIHEVGATINIHYVGQDKDMTLEKAISEILYYMIRDNKVSIHELRKCTLQDIYRIVFRESVNNILEQNGLDLEESEDRCKRLLLTFNCIQLDEKMKVELLKIIDEMRMEKIRKKNSVKREPELKLTKNGIPDKRTAAGKQWYAMRTDS